MRIVRRIIDEAEALGVEVHRLPNGATVIDMGVARQGGWEAARLFCQATLGGLGRLEYGFFDLDGIELPEVRVFIDDPAVALLSSQLSGWPLNEMKNEAGVVPLVSGPVRAVAQRDRFSQAVAYRDDSPELVAGLQDTRLPDERLTELIAKECGRTAADVYVLVASTASLVGAINVVSRTMETAIWRLHSLGLGADRIISAWGKAPLPPLTNDEYEAMVRTNTYTYYGGTVGFFVDEDDAVVRAAMRDFPLAPHTCPHYGVPFRKLLEDAGGDIFNVKGFVHCVTKGIANNVRSGKVHATGAVDKRMLRSCLD
jgi:methenyltetrahydromethanopterin cyclohydrolase